MTIDDVLEYLRGRIKMRLIDAKRLDDSTDPELCNGYIAMANELQSSINGIRAMLKRENRRLEKQCPTTPR